MITPIASPKAFCTLCHLKEGDSSDTPRVVICYIYVYIQVYYAYQNTRYTSHKV